jgi:hypothetical protein
MICVTALGGLAPAFASTSAKATADKKATAGRRTTRMGMRFPAETQPASL